MSPMNRLMQFREYLPHAGIVTAIVMAAVLFGLREGSPKNDGAAGADRWNLPNIPGRVAASPADTASVAALFYDEGGAKPKAQANPADLKWRFVGTARTGKTLTAIIVLPKRTGVLRLEQGAKLPSGEQIVAVDNGLMRYTDESGQHELRAFASETVPSKEEK
jgi:hypothetical protein